MEVDQPQTTTPRISAGDFVLIRMPSTNTKIVCMKPGTTISLGKFGSFKADNLIGQTFGATFEIQKDGKIIAQAPTAFDNADDTEANNKEINDDPTSQKMTFEQIEELKLKSIAGDVSAKEIIDSLTENNASFEKKTEYAKSKYIRRKERKFMKAFTPIEPTVFNLCGYFFEVNPGKIRGIRPDTLSQLLSLANVYSKARVLTVDDGQGLIAGSLLSRTTSEGMVFAMHDGDVSNYDVVRYMKLSPEDKERLRTLPWHRLDHEMTPFTEVLPENPTEKDISGYERRKRGHARLASNLETLRAGEFDALVISTNYNVMSVIKRLLPYVGGSRMVVVYSQSEETLIEAFDWMRHSPEFLNVQMTESWLREYQVLPNRTHPLMMTSGGGGFLLSAIHVLPEDA
ncbi:tRNA (adenine(58)-N(1))-methyltransferase non-catalytic subunit trm6 [Linderina pennispora]|nr:tRNA (adenine(58)-N(1))-methyltransferase non-catalytic subunit trm6 [Linderina pennispora]